MTRKYWKNILLLIVVIWFLVLLKLLVIVYKLNNDRGERKYAGIDDFVNIDYFKNYYADSIKVDVKNKNGHNGRPVKISDSEKYEKDRGYDLHKFNDLASSKIPLLRKIPDKRRDSCFTRTYTLDLPTASVIIIYHNEAWSTLLRTVHTVLSRSPDYLLREIILVDDFSDYERFPHLNFELDQHVAPYPKIKIIRSRKRIGLTQARLIGAKNAIGEVLVFLDSHCECSDGWLEPLLDDIKRYPNYAVTPIIDIINMDDFSITSGKINALNVGVFNWKADFTWHVPKHQMPSSDPIRSPTMAGGLFAINKDYFFEIGSYDEKMTFWGGENIEISFRLWMCGGGIYSDPCTIVGHVFRSHSPHDMATNSVLYNKLRAVEVWMDEYKEIVYSRIGIKRYDDRAGPLADRLNLRKELNCKSFKWYLENIAYDVRVPGKPTQIKNPITDLCLDAVDNGRQNNQPIKVIQCHGHGGNQAFEVTRDGSIIFEDKCLDLSSYVPDSKPVMYNCHGQGGNQKWDFVPNNLIKHSAHGLCLRIDVAQGVLIAVKCDQTDEHQIFIFTYSDP